MSDERWLGVVVADDQVLATVQGTQQSLDLLGGASREVAEVPDLIVVAHHPIPTADETCIVVGR